MKPSQKGSSYNLKDFLIHLNEKEDGKVHTSPWLFYVKFVVKLFYAFLYFKRCTQNKFYNKFNRIESWWLSRIHHFLSKINLPYYIVIVTLQKVNRRLLLVLQILWFPMINLITCHFILSELHGTLMVCKAQELKLIIWLCVVQRDKMCHNKKYR